MTEQPQVYGPGVRPGGCPGCHSASEPINYCIDPWHAEVGIAGWNDPLPVEDMGARRGIDWAGAGYDGRAGQPVTERTTTTWVCLDCPRSGGQGDPVAPPTVASGHAAEKRHIVQLIVTTIWVPEERS